MSLETEADDKLHELPAAQWPARFHHGKLMRVYAGRGLTVCVYAEHHATRLSVWPNTPDDWPLDWAELQRIKDECGFHDCDAVEVYPRKRDIVDVADVRHLWILPHPLPFIWRMQ